MIILYLLVCIVALGLSFTMQMVITLVQCKEQEQEQLNKDVRLLDVYSKALIVAVLLVYIFTIALPSVR